MKIKHSGFVIIEWLLLISIVSVVSISIMQNYGDVFNVEKTFQLNIQEPSIEMEYIAEITANEIFMEGDIESIDEIFAENYIGYNRKLSPEQQHSIDLISESIIKEHKNNFFYQPKLLKIEYYHDNFICYWAKGIKEFGIPHSREVQSNMVGISMFKVKQGKIVKGIYYNTRAVEGDEMMIKLFS